MTVLTVNRYVVLGCCCGGAGSRARGPSVGAVELGRRGFPSFTRMLSQARTPACASARDQRRRARVGGAGPAPHSTSHAHAQRPNRAAPARALLSCVRACAGAPMRRPPHRARADASPAVAGPYAGAYARTQHAHWRCTQRWHRPQPQHEQTYRALKKGLLNVI